MVVVPDPDLVKLVETIKSEVDDNLIIRVVSEFGLPHLRVFCGVPASRQQS